MFDLRLRFPASTYLSIAFATIHLVLLFYHNCANAQSRGFEVVEDGQSYQQIGSYYALLFATDNYDEWPDLNNPIEDARALKTELEDNYNFQVELVLDPTKLQILQKIQEYALKSYAPEDHLLIFFAGHGSYSEIHGDGYIISKESKLNDEVGYSYLAYSGLNNRVNNINSEHILLILDACFSGTFDARTAVDRGETREVDPLQLYINKLPFKTRRYITSGGKEYVSDGIPGQHSPFMRALLDGLRSYGGSSGMITLNRLFSFVENVSPSPILGEFADNDPGSDFIFLYKGIFRDSTLSQDNQASVPRSTPGAQSLTQQTANQFFSPSTNMEFIRIEPGQFRMGSDLGDADERPTHLVQITEPYYIGKYEVTQNQWEMVMGTTLAQQQLKAGVKGDYGTGPDYPMYYVTWEEARAFAENLSLMEGCDGCYRLPTEAEWEFAARARSPVNHSSSIQDVAWFSANSKNTAQPVGTKAANPWELYDMLGNVWEWVSDSYRQYTSTTKTDPQPLSTGSRRIARGGGWSNTASALRVTNRSVKSSNSRNDYLGFRLVRVTR